MGKNIKKWSLACIKNRIVIEISRILPLLGLAGFILLRDDASHVIIFGTAIVLLAVAVAHLVRKLIFPYIDIKSLVSGIEDDTKASAAVICGLIFLVCTIINAFVTLLK
jgi:hypothetical protein